ncbi:MAG: HIT family protein [Lachnospiraceae bacterium]|nr:HIT family protein [Lachnospiraceae bacterium]
MKDSNCIFCKIANGEIPSRTLYEDEDFRVIMDINPASKGHAIILPKEHAANLYELSDEYASKIFKVAKKVGSAMVEVLGCDGLNVLQNNGEAAGQTVFHLHVHLIPRYKDDCVSIGWKPGEADDTFLDSFVTKVQNIL